MLLHKLKIEEEDDDDCPWVFGVFFCVIVKFNFNDLFECLLKYN